MRASWVVSILHFFVAAANVDNEFCQRVVNTPGSGTEGGIFHAI